MQSKWLSWSTATFAPIMLKLFWNSIYKLELQVRWNRLILTSEFMMVKQPVQRMQAWIAVGTVFWEMCTTCQVVNRLASLFVRAWHLMSPVIIVHTANMLTCCSFFYFCNNVSVWIGRWCSWLSKSHLRQVCWWSQGWWQWQQCQMNVDHGFANWGIAERRSNATSTELWLRYISKDTILVAGLSNIPKTLWYWKTVSVS